MPDFFDRFIQFQYSLEHGRIPVAAIPQSHMTMIDCPDCGERCFRILYHGEQLFIVAGHAAWAVHQCPQPNEQQWPDDDQQRDQQGELI